MGKYKLLVAQNFGWSHTSDNGWKFPANGTDGPWAKGGERWISPTSPYPCGATSGPGHLGTLPGVAGQLPCLFDIGEPRSRAPFPSTLRSSCSIVLILASPIAEADASERDDLGANPTRLGLLNSMWKTLNDTVLTAFCKNVTGGSGGGSGCNSSPAKLLGSCNPTCAHQHWAKLNGGEGPICGVPGC